MNRDNNNMMDELLVKYLLAEATEAEQEEVQQWIAASAENKRYYEHFKLIWQRSRHLAATSTVDEHEAWKRFQQKVQAKDTKQDKEIVAPRAIAVSKPSINWMRVAAMLMVLALSGGLIYYFVEQGAPKMLALRSNESVMIDTLPDGSVVTLNKRSSLSYPETFKGDLRSVKLEGEAFFNITPNKSKPFVIDANGTMVKVVGTSFNVKMTNDKTEVIVETGVVEVSKKKKMVKLNPHEKATVLRDRDEPIKEANDDELYSYYKSDEFICDHTPLARLVEALNDAYAVHIVVTGNVANKQITTTFRDKSLDEILAVVAETLGLRIEKNGSEIIIK